MKKKFFGGIAVLAIAVVAILSVNLNANNSSLSGISLENVEALAACEEGIKKDGMIITTTVCDRKTSIMDRLLNICCGTTSSSSCSYTNNGAC